MAGVGRRGSYTIAAIFFIVHTVASAPVTEEGTSHSLQLGDANGDGRGCYYNFEHYDEGDRIMTNEPCLNCTCHNRMLMCYLRVCPFTKAIGQDCTVEKKPDQCCPIITCPQVPVALLTSSTTSETPPTTTALGRPDNYGCILEGNTFYPDGAQVPSDLRKPCELCYCIRNHTACVMQECTLNVEGCKPVYQEGVCCPVRYDCDYDEVLTTPKPVGLVTTPGGSSDCLHNGVVYHDGAMVMKDEKAPCEHCYCMRGDIVCAVQECGTPLEGRDCTPMEPTPGQCCPNYHCANGTTTSEATSSDLSSTEKIPGPVKEEVEPEKQDSDEESNETDNSSEESKESLSEPQPPQSAEDSDEETSSHHEVPAEAPNQSNVAEESSVTESNVPSVEEVHPTEVSQDPAPTSKPENPPVEEEHSADSESEASQHQLSETRVPEDIAKDPQATNEIPESTPYDQLNPSSITTDEPPVEAARIPGEGSCLVEGKTYAHNTIVPTTNPCQEVCRCFSSIVSCKPRDCPPAPSADENCMPVSTPGSCCPTYMCDQKTSDAPEVHDHKIDHFPHEENSHPNEEPPSTAQHVPEGSHATEAPLVTDVPPDSAIAESHEHALPAESVDSQNEHMIPTTGEPMTDNNQIIEENGQLNSDIVHEMDAALHGGNSEHVDSHEKGEPVHHAGDESTVGPASESNVIAGEEGFNAVTTYSTNESGETIQYSGQNEGTVKPDDPVMTEQEGSGQEESDPSANLDKISNESQSQIFSVNTESDSEIIVETTASTNILDGHEGHESVPYKTVNSGNLEVSTTSEIIKNEGGVTAIPLHPEVSSEENIYQTEQPSSSQPQYTVQGTHSDEPHTTESQQVLQENVQEVTTVSSSSEVSHDTINEENQSSQKEEEVITEAPQGSLSVSEHQQNQDSGLESTTIAFIEGHQDEPSLPQEGNEEVHNSNQSPTDSPPAKLPEESQEPITSVPMSNEESEGAAISATEESQHDAEPEPSHHNEETTDDSTSQSNVEQTQIKEEESTQHEGALETGNEHVLPEGIYDSSTATPPAQDNVNDVSEQVPHGDENPSENTEQENKGSELVEKNTELSAENSSQEAKPEDLTTVKPLPSEEVTTPKPSDSITVAASSQESSNVDYSTIIYEEVKVTGMPSIESHVTEGHSDVHPAASSTVTPDSQPDIPMPGPEGIKEEQQVENEAISEQTGNNAAQPEVPSEPISVTSDQKPEVDEPETHSEDELTSSHGEENKAPEDANEAGSAVSETIHQGTSAPEIANEINGEKESLSQISHDTAQLVDDINQTIQNEVSNELIPGENLEHMPTEQSVPSPVESEPESKPVEPSVEISHSDTPQETPAVPPVSSEEVEAHTSSPFAETIEDKKPVQAVNENSNNDLPESKPPQTIQEESHIESEPTNAALTPDNLSSQTEAPSQDIEKSSENTPAETEHEEIPSEETHKNEDEKVQDVASGVIENESSEPAAEAGSIESDQANSADETTQFTNNFPVTDKPEAGVQTSHHENQEAGFNELATETSEELIPEAQKEPTKEQEVVQESPTSEGEAVEAVSQASPEEDGKSPVSEDQNAIVEDVTHVEGSAPQAPDSANQLLENTEVQNTEQPTQGTEGDAPNQEVEEQPNQSTNAPHVDIIPNEENKNEIESDSEQQAHQETIAESQETSADHHESSENQEASSEQQETSSQDIPTQTENVPTEHHDETSVLHQETPSVSEHDEVNTDHHEISSEPQETLSEHHEISAEPTVTEHQETASESQETFTEHQEILSVHQEMVSEPQETESEHQETVSVPQENESDHQETTSEHQEIASVPQENESGHSETASEHQEIVSESNVIAQEETTSGPAEAVTQQEPISGEIESEHQESSSVVQDNQLNHQETTPESPETVSEHQETASEYQEVVTEHQEPASEHQEPVSEHHEPPHDHDESLLQQQETVSEHDVAEVTERLEVITQEPVLPQETTTEEHESVPDHQTAQPLDGESLHQEPVAEIQGVVSEHQEPVTEVHEITTVQQESDAHQDSVPQHQENLPIVQDESITQHPETPTSEVHENIPEKTEDIPQHHDNPTEQETVPQSQDLITEPTPTESVHQESSSEHNLELLPAQETLPEQHHDAVSEQEIHIPSTESSDKEVPTTSQPETSSEILVTDGIHRPASQEISTESHAIPEEGQKQEVSTTIAPQSSQSSEGPISSEAPKPELISEQIQSLIHSTETAILSEIPSSTQKPIIEDPSPMFPSWSQKPFDHHTTPEPHAPEENPYPSGFDPEYEDEEGVSYGPGTCRYGGKVYLSAQQIPRDDPCDFCFCFRSDIICLQQSCPPPIRGCYQETIKGFCCPRYECHVSMATMLNITTTTTTTTTTLPPHFFAHAYNGAATKAGCQVKGVAYHVGERIPSTSGPCLECRCGANGQMKCDPTVCGPQEALLRQVMDAAVSKRRR